MKESSKSDTEQRRVSGDSTVLCSIAVQAPESDKRPCKRLGANTCIVITYEATRKQAIDYI